MHVEMVSCLLADTCIDLSVPHSERCRGRTVSQRQTDSRKKGNTSSRVDWLETMTTAAEIIVFISF